MTLTFSEALELLRVHENTLYAWCAEGKIPAYKVGKQWRFMQEELLEWMRGDEDGEK